MRVLVVQHQADCSPGLVGERLAELGAKLDVVDPRGPLPDPSDYQLVVPLGSADSAADDSLDYLPAEWRLLRRAVRADVPVFGICFGAQLLCRVLGGTVVPAPTGPEIGWMTIEVGEANAEAGLAGPWLEWHHDTLVPPPGSQLAHSAAGSQVYQVGRAIGVQFHPEVTPETVATWAVADGATVRRLGIDVPDLLARMRADAADNAARVADLVDWVLTRTRSP
jgi:GMP synthase-like glutamine amidotransferase